MLCCLITPPTGGCGLSNEMKPVLLEDLLMLLIFVNQTHASFLSADVEKVCTSTNKIFFRSKLEEEKSFFSTSLGLIVAIINHEPAQYDGDGEAILASSSQAAKDFSPLSVFP